MNRNLHFLFLLGSLLLLPAISQAQKIIFTPQWTPQAQFAGYYVAQDKGFYREAGLDVDIVHPSASQSALSRIARNESHATTLMLPQAIPDEARLVIEYEAAVDGVTSVHTLEARLRSRSIPEWQMGKIYTYQISVVSLALQYETFINDWEMGGQTDVHITF